VTALARHRPYRSSQHRSPVAHWRTGVLAVFRIAASPCQVVQRLLDSGSSYSHQEEQSTAAAHLDRCTLAVAQRTVLRRDVVGMVGREGSMAVLGRRR
jgi:hypothetical protein